MFKHTNILSDYLDRRTTVLLEKEVYEELVKESLEEYKNTKSISKVLNEILKKRFRNRSKLLKLIRSKPVAFTTAKEFEKFRGELSKSV